MCPVGFVEADDKDVPMAQLMAEINHQLSDAQANRIEVEAYVRMIDQGRSDAVPSVRDDQLYQNLVTRFADSRDPSSAGGRGHVCGSAGGRR